MYEDTKNQHQFTRGVVSTTHAEIYDKYQKHEKPEGGQAS